MLRSVARSPTSMDPSARRVASPTRVDFSIHLPVLMRMFETGVRALWNARNCSATIAFGIGSVAEVLVL